MALDIPVRLFEQLAGHDGGEIVFPDLSEPLCRRGFHVSEAVLVALRLDYAATPIELFPVIAASDGPATKVVHYGHAATPEYNWVVGESLIHGRRGVIEARTRSGYWHAVAFDRGHIYDPDGRHFQYSREDCENRGLFISRIWQIEKLKA